MRACCGRWQLYPNIPTCCPFLGAAGSFVVSRLIGSMLYGVEPTDFATFAGMAVLLLAVAGLAGYLPAARASRTDPVEALRTS